VYHCTPDALDRQDPIRILTHLNCLSVEADVQRMRNKR
jgi:hypothetical protein